MMNIPPELESYIGQNHANHHSSSSLAPPDYGYLALPLQPQPHQPHSTSQPSQGTGGHQVGSKAASEDNLVYYNNPLPPIHQPLQQYPGREGNVTTSLYGLVTASPEVAPSPYAPLGHPHTFSPATHQCHNGTPVPSRTHRPSHAGHGYHHHSHHTHSAGMVGQRAEVRISNSSASALYGHHKSGFHHQHHHSSTTHHHGKRKSSPVQFDSEPDDDSETCSSRRTTTPTDESSKKQNHSEIEKRRRDKMNTYITELSGMVPMCSAMSRKLDKLTVLRMAVQHMKTLRGSRIHSYTEGHYKPSFLTDEELKHLILQSAEGFLFVVGCDRGRLLYVSESVSQVLNYTQSDLLGQSWFDILHPKDVAKVKEQLSSSDLAPRERLIDAKTMLPVKGNVPQKANRLCPGARRSFFCRMKCRTFPLIKEEMEPSTCQQQRRKKASSSDRKFCVMHCTGYLKSWAKVGVEEVEGDGTEDPCNLSCLVAVGRVLNSIEAPPRNSKHRPVTFFSRHAVDGKFAFVDQRTTLAVGFLPQELLGTSMYEYFHHDDIASLAEVHKAVLASTEAQTTPDYRFRTKNGNCVRLQSAWKTFRNPWTREIEYIIATNTLLPNEPEPVAAPIPHPGTREGFPGSNEFDFFAGNGGAGPGGLGNGEIQRLITSEVPFRKIGAQIADEVMETQRRNDSSSSNSPDSVLEATALGAAAITDLQLPSMLSPNSQSTMLQQAQIGGTRGSPSSTTGFSTSGHSGPGDGEELALSSRTNDPLMGSTGNPGVSNLSTPTGTGGEGGSQRPGVNGNNNVIRNNSANNVLNEPDEEMLYMIGDAVLPASPSTSQGDGNDEAAMAVIMSLLEADAGLGGPIDYSGLPWMP